MKTITPKLDLAEHEFLSSARIGHLATADGNGRPHVVPVCYAVLNETIYIVIDRKPKKSDEPGKLRRVANIRENPQVCLTVDRYDEDWSRLAFVMIHGTAGLLNDGPRHQAALDALRARYTPYRTQDLEQRPIIAIRIDRVSSWGRL